MEWPDNLIKDLAKRKCIVFLGSGISRNSTNKDNLRPPSWSDFLSKGIESLGNKDKKDYADVAGSYLKKNDLLMACEVVRMGLGKHAYHELLKESFQTPGYEHAPIHEHIFDLDSKIVITPNFDKIYDVYAQSKSHSTVVIKSYTDQDIVDSIKSEEPMIVKMHGSIDKPGELIFSRKDYSEAWNKAECFYRIIESLMLTHSFLFLGAGLDDPDIRMILERFIHSYCPSKKHYFVIPEGSTDKITLDILSDLLGMEFITYPGVDNHSALTQGLEELKNEVEIARASLQI